MIKFTLCPLFFGVVIDPAWSIAGFASIAVLVPYSSG
ncbi:TPA: DUF1270 family protein [Staphylococcus aureus]|nr:DUF1270 family protein [Staphylococcus aureus]